ncbi:hypothetical protein ACFPDQ_08460 [Pseudofrancisella aestuarii]|uniref:HlyD family type I secretion periplasmic adaptor subunit n=1 Tax=Pseudofrancisella aestuarii TaxID=2670347 RepID=A0ABV9TEG0_9GAMM|nr:hypothetical protein [Pseudofrancisella aestuarii]
MVILVIFPRVLATRYRIAAPIEDDRLSVVYKLIVSLNDNTLHKDGEDYKIVPGVAVVAEVKTGTRRVIDFFTEPLTRGIDNSLRER